ncbi:hypothetical protein Clacol_007599 [Clathrus columnatus]|uniref:Uncharacterized protein n=1 Tax=Clathrus columnatus TaxID=1419009 RepID=A0AAV5AI42_9AGAM|nr:hypothetical protein Clacol_007599 [Clathrus columnatus]
MSFIPLDDTTAWGDNSTSEEFEESDIVSVAMKKERVLREIIAAQEDLQALFSRVKTVQEEVDKLSSGNQTLQMYIDNLTKQLARR